MTFCSKWFYFDSARLTATRDLHKTLSTKQYYTKRNALIFKNPSLHRSAILLGLKAETVSRLLEDIIQASLPKSGIITQATDYVKYVWSSYVETTSV